jgi:cobalt-precorrin 5A hydrolase
LNNLYAAIAITKHGAEHARTLGRRLPGVAVYYGSKFAHGDEEALGITLFETTQLRQVLPGLFRQYRGLIFFVSLGAVVRLIAPLLKDKKTDPAVVVVDDRCEHAISVLSGHLGGANELTREVARCLDARPVITTASDVGETIPVDLFGRSFGWEIESYANVTPVSASVVNEETVVIVQEAGETGWWPYDKPLPAHFRIFSSTADAMASEFQAALVVTDRLLNQQEEEKLLANGVLYRPKTIVLGIGCNRGTPLEEIEQVVMETLQELQLAIKSVYCVATIDIKKDEEGLLALCRKYHWELRTYPAEQLNSVTIASPSETVYRYTGAYGVSEPAAILASGARRALLPKKKSGNVTISVALRPLAGQSIQEEQVCIREW